MDARDVVARARDVVDAMTKNTLFRAGAMVSLSRRLARATRALARDARDACDRALFATVVVRRATDEGEGEEYEDVEAFAADARARDASARAFRARYVYEGCRGDATATATRARGTTRDRAPRGVRLDAITRGRAFRTRVDGETVYVAHRSGTTADDGDGETTDGSWYGEWTRATGRRRRAATREDDDSDERFEVKMWRLFRSDARVEARMFALMRRGRAAKKRRLLENAREHTAVYVPKTVTQYHDATPGRPRAPAQQNWIHRAKPSRPLETVVLPPGARERLVADVDDFLSSERWYVDRGLPWRRGYLLHGLPGTGKTSLVFALAGHFKLPLYTIRLSDGRLDDEGLHWLFSNTARRSIILLDDVDAPGANAVFREPSVGQRAESPSASSAEQRAGNLSVSSTLSLLDGVTAVDGRLIFLTCREKASLNQALIRPGRVDVVFHFDAPDKEQIASYFTHFYAESGVGDGELRELANAFAAIAVDANKTPKSMAAFQALFIANKDDPAGALEAMRSRAPPRISTRASTRVRARARARGGGDADRRDASPKLEAIETNA